MDNEQIAPEAIQTENDEVLDEPVSIKTDIAEFKQKARLMSIKEVVEQISIKGLAKANGPNRRFLLSHLRAGNITATAFPRLPIELPIKMPPPFWYMLTNGDFDSVSNFYIDLKFLSNGFEDKAKITNFIDTCKKDTSIASLKGVKLKKALDDLDIEIAISESDWNNFISIPAINAAILKNKSYENEQEEKKSNNAPKNPDHSDKRMKAGWDTALQITVLSVLEHYGLDKNNFLPAEILKLYNKTYDKSGKQLKSLLPAPQTLRKKLEEIPNLTLIKND